MVDIGASQFAAVSEQRLRLGLMLPVSVQPVGRSLTIPFHRAIGAAPAVPQGIPMLLAPCCSVVMRVQAHHAAKRKRCVILVRVHGPVAAVIAVAELGV